MKTRKLYTIQEFLKLGLLSATPSGMRGKCHRGEVPSVQIGATFYIPHAYVEKLQKFAEDGK